MAYNQNYGNRNGGGFQKNQLEDKSETPEPVRIESFYKEDGKTLQEDLFDTTARNVAKSLVGKNLQGRDIGVTSTQLRRIFDEVKRFEKTLQFSDSNWQSQFPYIKMIKSKVAYSVARAAKQKSEEKGVYKNLETFISSGIDLIKSQKDYEAFVNLFEAAYGFYYELAPKNCL